MGSFQLHSILLEILLCSCFAISGRQACGVLEGGSASGAEDGFSTEMMQIFVRTLVFFCTSKQSKQTNIWI